VAICLNVQVTLLKNGIGNKLIVLTHTQNLFIFKDAGLFWQIQNYCIKKRLIVN